MALIPPAKLKEFLSTVKETLLVEPQTGDATAAAYPTPADTPASFSIYIQALLCLECAQRGVLVNFDSDLSAVLESVRSTAGKALLMEAHCPKPLLSGLSVIQGRIAEATASQLATDNKTTLSLDAKSLKSVLQRTQDVQDRRFECLLQVLQAIHDAATTTTPEQQIQLCRIIAEGCYYRATEFVSDAPPLWKRIVDLHVQDGSSVNDKDNPHDNSQSPHDNWRAVAALEHMQSIAATKGNAKRVQELSVALAEHVMSVADESAASNTTTSSSSLMTFFLQTFIEPYRPVEPYSLLEATQKASQYLQHPLSNDADNQLVFRQTLLALRISLARERATIQQAADADYTAAKNRSATASKREVYQQARQSYLADCAILTSESGADDDNDNSSLQRQATALRNAVLARGESTTANSDAKMDHDIRTRQAYRVLCDHLVRQHEQAKAVATKSIKKKQSSESKTISEMLVSIWKGLQESVLPVLEDVSGRVQSVSGSDENALSNAHVQEWIETITTEQYAFLQQTVQTLLFAEWMLSSVDASTSLIPLSLLRLPQEVLMVMLTKERSLMAARSQGALIQSDSLQNATCRRLECAFRSCRAWVCLAGEAVDGMVHREITSDAVSHLNDMDIFGDSVNEFGMSYLEFLVCWSGLTKEAWSYCVMSESRNMVVKAKACVETAAREWRRYISSSETAIIDIALADAEIVSASGGLLEEAKKVYSKNSECLSDKGAGFSPPLHQLLLCKCIFGLSVLMRQIDEVGESTEGIEGSIRSELKKIVMMIAEDVDGHLYLWRSPSATRASLQFHLAAGRQLLADILLRNRRAKEAQVFLEQAVKDSPGDPAALFSLGAFHLRMMFFAVADENEAIDRSKLAQAYLLRAAKADPNRASPFALLGYWYEHANDTARAIGCYSKALLIDRLHPVAGRGIMRLRSIDTIKAMLDSATTEAAPLNGWAWHALGLYSAQSDGNDDLAIVSLVAALRCRDIANPQSDSLAYFYSDPHQPAGPGLEAFVSVSEELAACYRRAGRYTASIRCYESAIDAAGDLVSCSVLCACAQVELELGLFDEASEKFTKARQMNANDILPMTSYGLGLTLLSLARRDLQDGKAGAAMETISRGIQCCEASADDSMCTLKLLGDLHSFVANLPPDVIPGSSSDETESLSNQLSLVSKGIDYYRKAEQASDTDDAIDEDRMHLKASILCDIGCNFLSQGQLIAHAEGQGLGLATSDADGLFLRAEESFVSALNLHDYAPAWCGLGCSLYKKDPLMSQHAFCRSIELDNLSPDAYSNLSFLYTFRNLVDASVQMSDAVTKVADTPFMWINRALLAERKAGSDAHVSGDILLRQAADAYRAALQVSTTYTAKEGLALTCRVDRISKQSHFEMNHLLSEYLALTGRASIPVAIFHGLSLMEIGRDGDIEEGKEETREALLRLQAIQHATESVESLKANAIAAALSQQKGESDAAASTGVLSLGNARQVFYQPDDGQLWLQLAKQMLNRTDPSPEQLQNARRALVKARYILIDASKEGTAKAEDLSDALALECLMDRLTDDARVQATLVPIQKALLLNPGNTFAREACI